MNSVTVFGRLSVLSRAVPIEQCCPLYPALRACGILAASGGGLTLLLYSMAVWRLEIRLRPLHSSRFPRISLTFQAQHSCLPFNWSVL